MPPGEGSIRCCPLVPGANGNRLIPRERISTGTLSLRTSPLAWLRFTGLATGGGLATGSGRCLLVMATFCMVEIAAQGGGGTELQVFGQP